MKRLVAILLLAIMLTSVMPLTALADEHSNFIVYEENSVSSYAGSYYLLSVLEKTNASGLRPIKTTSTLTIDQLRAKFPDGKYWNSPRSGPNNPDGYTETPCHHGSGSSSYICNRFLASGQCYGYARKLGYDYYGTDPVTEWPQLRNRSALEDVKPGDIIRYSTSSSSAHSVFVLAVEENYYIVSDCNSDHHCIIRWDREILKSRVYNNFLWVWSAPYAAGVCEHSFINSGSSVYCDVCGAEYECEKTSMYARFRANTNSIEVMSNPYPFAAASLTLTNVSTLNVIAEHINYYGDIWYEIEGGGYVYSGYLSFDSFMCDVRVEDATYPVGAITPGTGFPLQGVVLSRNPISTIVVGVFERDGDPTSQVVIETGLETYSYDVYDADSNILFGQLAEGAYTYVVYAEDIGGSRCILLADFNIGSEGDITYSVRYDANGGYNAPFRQDFSRNSSITLSSQTPNLEGCRFAGWNTSEDGGGYDYRPGQTYANNASLYLYAKWECDVTFVDGLTGETIAETVVDYGNEVAPPIIPLHQGYTFIGWDYDLSSITRHVTVTSQHEFNHVMGDADDNGLVSTLDALIILRIAMEYTTPNMLQLITCDINGNGIIDTVDALSTLRLAMGATADTNAAIALSRNSVAFNKLCEIVVQVGKLG